MTARPSFNSKRPLSAIFLGSTSHSQIPDLPDPPISPTSSSGLPSPPATNSTGSGSTGDASTNHGSVRRPLTSETRPNMHNGIGSSNNSPQRRSRTSSEEGDDDNEEDHTAKLSDDRRLLLQTRPNENASALFRVKSLTQRNRMVLDKLASISSGSRLSTPSPPNALRHSRTPPAPSSSSSSTTSSRLSSASVRRSHNDSGSGMSGSETERERTLSTSYSSDDLSATPPSTVTVPFRSESVRQRRTSAPATPEKAFTQVFKKERDNSTPPVSGPVVTPRKRASMTDSSDGSVDVASAASAAVASSRRSPTGGKRRQPLPKEFRDRKSLDDIWAREPSTPHRNADRTASPGVHVARGSPSPRSHAATLNDSPQSPRPRTHRYSTVRDMARRHQTRWLSQDLSSAPDDIVDEDTGRRQTRRAGSNDSPFGLTGGRSVVGESLRAAGLAKKREGDDVFGGENDLQTARKLRLSGGLGTRPSLADGEGHNLRAVDGPTLASRSPSVEPHTPAQLQRAASRNTQSALATRPATSMASYQEEPRTAPPLLRSHKSSYPLNDRERDRQAVVSLDNGRPASQAQTRNQFQSTSRDRSYMPPSTVGRRNVLSSLGFGSSGSASTPEHTRLMLDSLGMFESYLARLPSMGTTTTLTIPELFRSAQQIVHSANSLNTLIRNGTSHALEEQIDAEVRDNEEPVDPAEIWRTVGGEYRETLRVSDELVRTMTSFLLGVGKVLRETTSGTSQHSRGSSLDDNVTRRPSPEVGGRRSAEIVRGSNDWNSSDVRRGWEPNVREQEERLRRVPSRSELYSSRPSSSLNDSRDIDQSREAGYAPNQDWNKSKLSINVRHSFTAREPREQLEQNPSHLNPSTSTDNGLSYEPSPTPVVRNQLGQSRRTLPPISVPPPLSTLPSESLLTRNGSKSIRRGKFSSTSNATVRANSIFPSITSPNPTTAITTTSASASPEKRTPLALREASGSNFSRSNTLSGAALAGLQQQFARDGRKRTISGSSNTDAEASPITARSGSETERDTRRAINSRARQSLDSNHSQEVQFPTEKRERRRTVTDMFTRS